MQFIHITLFLLTFWYKVIYIHNEYEEDTFQIIMHSEWDQHVWVQIKYKGCKHTCTNNYDEPATVALKAFMYIDHQEKF